MHCCVAKTPIELPSQNVQIRTALSTRGSGSVAKLYAARTKERRTAGRIRQMNNRLGGDEDQKCNEESDICLYLWNLRRTELIISDSGA